MDIVPKIKFTDLKGSFATLALKHKLFLVLFLFSLTATIIPHTTMAVLIPVYDPEALVFNISDFSWQDELGHKSQTLTDQHYAEQLRQQALKHARLVAKVRAYLQNRNSPLSEYSEVLVSLSNWKKIVALSNAESGMCEKYPVATANCWGVGGGSGLLDFGNTLGDGVITMNRFLNANPRRTKIKYAQMTFDQMNGLYKQPAKEHWVTNNQSVYDELVAIEKSVN